MLKNNKGFMLIEVIVTSTIVLTSMIALYTSFNKLYNNYNVKNSYYNIDATYATKLILNSMFESDENFGNINEIIKYADLNDKKYQYIIKNASCNKFEEPEFERTTYYAPPKTCEGIIGLYKINNILIVRYDKNILLELNNDLSLNQTFSDYINYLVTYYDIKNSEQFSWIVLTELKEGENYYYANLRVR